MSHTEFDSKRYEELKQLALDSGIHVVHTIFNNGNKLFGYTFAWRRAEDRPDSALIEVAVTFTAPSETKFVKRLGTFYALSNFDNCETVRLPIGSKDNSEIIRKLRVLFNSVLAFNGRF